MNETVPPQNHIPESPVDSSAMHADKVSGTIGFAGNDSSLTPWLQEINREQGIPDKPVEPAADKQKSGHLLAHRIGKWSHEHKDAMKNSWLPWYGVRNAMASVVGITALVTILVPTRYGFSKLRNATAGSEGAVGKAINIASSNFIENVIGTGLSFAGFRTGYKLWQRNYDRIFVKPNTEEEATNAVSNLPTNIAKDLRYLAPVEIPATLIAAVPLVAMRSGVRVMGNHFNRYAVKEGETTLFKIPGERGMVLTDASGLVGKGLDSPIKDIIGCIPAYTAFFEFGERMFDDFQTRRGYTKNEHSHSHVKGILPPEEQSREKKPYDAMLEDTPARMYFYKVASVAAGIIPYIGWSRYAQDKLKWKMNPARDGVFKSWAKEQGMYQGFALYTVGSELARNNIDKVFKKLQDKELEKKGESHVRI